MADAFTNRYEEFLDGNYDCVDRIVINAYLPGVGRGRRFPELVAVAIRI